MIMQVEGCDVFAKKKDTPSNGFQIYKLFVLNTNKLVTKRCRNHTIMYFFKYSKHIYLVYMT